VGNTIETLADHGIVTLVDPQVPQIHEWAKAVANGGVRVFGVPVAQLGVTSLVDEITDGAGLIAGVTGVLEIEQLSIALAAGAEYIYCPVADASLIAAAKARGLDVIASGMTPSEVGAALLAGADMVAVDPAGALGFRYFESIARQFRGARLIAAGGIDIESAPRFLELGAVAAIVDRGIFPEANEPAALEVISARAQALVEVCSDVLSSRPTPASSAPKVDRVTEPTDDTPVADVTPIHRSFPVMKLALRRARPASVPPPIPRSSARPSSVPPPIPLEARSPSVPPAATLPPPRATSTLPPRPRLRSAPHLISVPRPSETVKRSSPAERRATPAPSRPAARRAPSSKHVWRSVPPPPRVPRDIPPLPRLLRVGASRK